MNVRYNTTRMIRAVAGGGMKFDQIQAEMIQAAYDADVLNKGSNRKTGNLKSELDGGIRNYKAKKTAKDVAASKLTGTKQKQ